MEYRTVFGEMNMTAYFVRVVITYQLAEGRLTFSLFVNNNNNNNNIHVFASAE
jgi:hypothetical protein